MIFIYVIGEVLGMIPIALIGVVRIDEVLSTVVFLVSSFTSAFNVLQHSCEFFINLLY